MGGISGSREFFVESLIEIAGYKAGVVITPEQLLVLLEGYSDLSTRLSPSGPAGLRLHSVEFEEAVVHLLYRLGNTSSPSNISISIELHHKYKNNAKLYPIFNGVMKEYVSFIKSALEQQVENKALDPSPLMDVAVKKYGRAGLEIVFELIKGTNRDLHRSAWGTMRTTEWKDEVELNELFTSEKLDTLHGRFFDQRFIDYIGQNFEDIGNIHWRKFEGLTAEYFERQGLRVDIGPGRNDEGIDLRIHPAEGANNGPPLIIVQCKRQKAKIDKALIKSVYADVIYEKAESGLIVTTSYLSPGAATMRIARNYPVETADRQTLRDWIKKMRTQG